MRWNWVFLSLGSARMHAVPAVPLIAVRGPPVRVSLQYNTQPLVAATRVDRPTSLVSTTCPMPRLCIYTYSSLQCIAAAERRDAMRNVISHTIGENNHNTGSATTHASGSSASGQFTSRVQPFASTIVHQQPRCNPVTVDRTSSNHSSMQGEQ
jgi:hypothetical protein